LDDIPGIEVIGEAVNGADLLEQVKHNTPDIILMDISMPVMNGIEATRVITKDYPLVAVIALSAFNNEYHISEMIRAGAKGFLLKVVTKADLSEAIITVYNNGNFYCASTLKKMEQPVTSRPFYPGNKAALHLTLREKEVLYLICLEKSNSEIADLLEISVRTVEGFRTSLFAKTKAVNIAGLVLFAINHGIYRPEENA
jgi:DNA-binding NarL/FixJ family response regulator